MGKKGNKNINTDVHVLLLTYTWKCVIPIYVIPINLQDVSCRGRQRLCVNTNELLRSMYSCTMIFFGGQMWLPRWTAPEA